jgi:hypothetical protein
MKLVTNEIIDNLLERGYKDVVLTSVGLDYIYFDAVLDGKETEIRVNNEDYFFEELVDGKWIEIDCVFLDEYYEESYD